MHARTRARARPAHHAVPRPQLDNPNPASIASNEAYQAWQASKTGYLERQRAEAAQYKLKYNADG